MIDNINENLTDEKLDNLERILKLIDPENELFTRTKGAIRMKRVLMNNNNKESINESMPQIDK